MRIPVLLTILLATLLTHRTATHPSTPPPHASVLNTVTYALGAGTMTNVLCAAGAHLTGYVPGMESEACMPWSIVAVAVSARLHVFKSGGWGREKREYAKGLGGTGVRWVLGGPGRWFETFEMWEEGLVKEDGGFGGEGEEAAGDGEEFAGEAEG